MPNPTSPDYNMRAEMSATGKLGGLTSCLNRYMDQADIPKAGKVQRRVRLLLLRYQQAQLEIKSLQLQLDILAGKDDEQEGRR